MVKYSKKRKDFGTIKIRINNFADDVSEAIPLLFVKYYDKLEINQIELKIKNLTDSIVKYEQKKDWNIKFDTNHFICNNDKKNYFQEWCKNNKNIIEGYKNSEHYEEKCSICLQKIHDNNVLASLFGDKISYQLNCSHCFHFECLDKWRDECNYKSDYSWKKKLTCPICRNYDKHDYLNKISDKYNDIYKIHLLN